jgi:hypothetical protein
VCRPRSVLLSSTPIGNSLTSTPGLKVCGPDINSCLRPGYSCCKWGGQCEPGTFCDAPTAGESGEPGCCENGLNCNAGGGELPGQTDIIPSTITFRATVSSKSSASIHETVTPPSTLSAASVAAPSSTPTAVFVPSSVVSTSTTKISSVSIPITTGSRNTGAPTNGTVPSAPGLPTQVPGSGASSGSVHGSVQAGFVGAAVVIAGLFVL